MTKVSTLRFHQLFKTKLGLSLTTPPVLTSPSEGETLLLYTAATPHAVSSTLVVEREEEGHALKVQ